MQCAPLAVLVAVLPLVLLALATTLHSGTNSKASSQPLPARLPPCSERSVAADPVLSFITSRMAAARRPSSINHSSSSSSLPPGVQQWEVQWADIRLRQQIGRGSFGRVRKKRACRSVCSQLCGALDTGHALPHACSRPLGLHYHPCAGICIWGETQVAVKVLVATGE